MYKDFYDEDLENGFLYNISREQIFKRNESLFSLHATVTLRSINNILTSAREIAIRQPGDEIKQYVADLEKITNSKRSLGQTGTEFYIELILRFREAQVKHLNAIIEHYEMILFPSKNNIDK